MKTVLSGLRSPARGAMPMPAAERLAAVLSALSSPARLRILSLLADGPLCVTDLTTAVGLTQPTVSSHMRVLRKAGLVDRLPRGAKVEYVLDRDTLGALARLLDPECAP